MPKSSVSPLPPNPRSTPVLAGSELSLENVVLEMKHS